MSTEARKSDTTILSKKWIIHSKGMKAEDIRDDFLHNLEYNIAKDKFTFTKHD
jgi:hypothetical protein